MTVEADPSRFRTQTNKAVITGGDQADIGDCRGFPAAMERFSMKYVYGPVPSRRLGHSLGVDLISFKTCNYNCVYCQLGRTTPLTNERRGFFPRQAILVQVREALEHHQPGQIDYLTFVGQGEPTMCASLGWLIRHRRRHRER